MFYKKGRWGKNYMGIMGRKKKTIKRMGRGGEMKIRGLMGKWGFLWENAIFLKK